MAGNYVPADNGTFMSKVVDNIKRNPTMLMAGASLLGRSNSGDMVKFAVAAYAAYRLYQRHEDKRLAIESGTYKNAFQRTAEKATGAAKTLYTGGKTLFDKGKQLATSAANTTRERLQNAQDNHMNRSIEKRFEALNAYEAQKNAVMDPKLGFSKGQFDAAIERVAPLSATPTMKAMEEAALADPHGEGGKAQRRYLDNVLCNAEHQQAWEQHMTKNGVQDLSQLKFCALGEDGKPLLDAKGKTVTLDPYASLGARPKGAEATPEALYAWSAKKADIDKTIMYAMDHGQMGGLSARKDGTYDLMTAPKDSYNKNLDAMDAANREFAATKAVIRSEQMTAYLNAPEAKVMAACPAHIQAAGKSADFAAMVQAVNASRADMQQARADAAAQGVDYERVQVAEVMKTAKPAEISLYDSPSVDAEARRMMDAMKAKEHEWRRSASPEELKAAEMDDMRARVEGRSQFNFHTSPSDIRAEMKAEDKKNPRFDRKFAAAVDARIAEIQRGAVEAYYRRNPEVVDKERETIEKLDAEAKKAEKPATEKTGKQAGSDGKPIEKEAARSEQPDAAQEGAESKGAEAKGSPNAVALLNYAKLQEMHYRESEIARDPARKAEFLAADEKCLSEGKGTMAFSQDWIDMEFSRMPYEDPRFDMQSELVSEIESIRHSEAESAMNERKVREAMGHADAAGEYDSSEKSFEAGE